MIKPTLFVGLGTTGTEILKTLRKLMSEEFKNSGLPLFRYIAIETRETETGDNPRHAEDYEQITVVNATIEDTAPIDKKLDSNQPNYNPYLADWLNRPLLNKIQSFRDGARNIRMAGRLCLWENWRQIQRTLASANANIIDPANRNYTLDLLTQHYKAKHLDVPDSLVDLNGINAYVVGTLCGGSCSGMLIDMAYFLRHLLGGSIHNKIYGVFTMFDRLSAEDTAEDISVHAANCYAGLSELNYYNHTGTTYDVTFPNNQRVNTTQNPFDYAMFVSPTGKLPTIRFVAGGGVDEEGLNLMVALNLFAEAAGDTDGKKGDIRTDWVSFASHGGMKEVPVGETSTMVKCLASFGLTAVWYPKYRIANAAACKASQGLCQNWSNGHTDRATIKTEARQEWDNIKGNVDMLSSPEQKNKPSLVNEINSLLNTAEQAFNRKDSADELRGEMNAFPPKVETGPFNTRFAEGGKYHAWMAGNVDKCKKAFINAIESSFDNHLKRIDLQGTYGLGDVRAFFEELDQIIKQAQEQCPSQLPTLNLDSLDFEPMRTAKNFWTRLAGKQEEAVQAHRLRLIDEYHQLIVGKEGIYQKVRYYFLRQVLQVAREKLGFEVHADDTTINRQLNQIETTLKDCDKVLQKDYESEIEPPQYECVKIVTNNPQDSIKTDADDLSKRIIEDITTNELLVDNNNQIEMDAFLNKEHTDIKLQMTETYRRSALHKINVDADDGIANALVVTKAQEILNTAGDDIKDLARRSNPYQEFISGYEEFDLSEKGGPKIIFGHDPTETKENLTDLQHQLDFGRTGNSSVDHLLFFYEEEASFTLDDLAAYNALKQHFDTNPGKHGHLTHQDPNFYDITLPEKRAKLEQWCHALVQLVPEIRKNTPQAFTDVFEHQNQDIIYIYQDEMKVDKPLSLAGDEQGIKELCRQENEAAYTNFFNAVTDQFNKVGMPIVNQLVNDLTGREKNIEERRSLATFFSEFLREVYPDGGETITTIPHLEPKIDSPVSETASQISENITGEEQSETPPENATTSDTDIQRGGEPEETVHS